MDNSDIDPILSGDQRRKCWELQNKYVQCLESHELKCIYKDGNKVNFKSPPECESLRDFALSKCPESWVRHFEFKWAKAKLLEKSLEDFNNG